MADQPLVGVLMGSKSDWELMQHVCAMLDELGIPNETRVTSAHRTPDETHAYAATAKDRGLKVLICGAGGAAHLAGMVAAKTPLPVLGVPMPGWALNGLDSLLSTVMMPGGVPVATFAIGKAGCKNAAIFAAQILATSDPAVADRLDAFRASQTDAVRRNNDPRA
jgi:5-(carboxyamino)imidazole ribonucleotide mutase